jgi:hypothetical protein
MSKMQWQRQSNGCLELFVYENNQWKLYTKSKFFQPDSLIKGASRGMETFRACLKQNYEIVATPQK